MRSSGCVKYDRDANNNDVWLLNLMIGFQAIGQWTFYHRIGLVNCSSVPGDNLLGVANLSLTYNLINLTDVLV